MLYFQRCPTDRVLSPSLQKLKTPADPNPIVDRAHTHALPKHSKAPQSNIIRLSTLALLPSTAPALRVILRLQVNVCYILRHELLGMESSVP